MKKIILNNQFVEDSILLVCYILIFSLMTNKLMFILIQSVLLLSVLIIIKIFEVRTTKTFYSNKIFFDFSENFLSNANDLSIEERKKLFEQIYENLFKNSMKADEFVEKNSINIITKFTWINEYINKILIDQEFKVNEEVIKDILELKKNFEEETLFRKKKMFLYKLLMFLTSLACSMVVLFFGKNLSRNDLFLISMIIINLILFSSVTFLDLINIKKLLNNGKIKK